MNSIYITLDGKKIHEYPAFHGYILYSLYNFSPKFDKSLWNDFKILIYPLEKSIDECLENGWYNLHHIGDFRFHQFFSNYFQFKLPFRKLLLKKFEDYLSISLQNEERSLEEFIDSFANSFHNSMILEYVDEQKKIHNQTIFEFYNELTSKLGLCLHQLPIEFDAYKLCIASNFVGREGYTASMYGLMHPLFYITLGCSQTGNFTIGISYHKLPFDSIENLLASFNTILGSDIETFVHQKNNVENKLGSINYDVFTFYTYDQNYTSEYDSYLTERFTEDWDHSIDLRENHVIHF
jgi:hypothetical protein